MTITLSKSLLLAGSLLLASNSAMAATITATYTRAEADMACEYFGVGL